jgi:hypothetical protein
MVAYLTVNAVVPGLNLAPPQPTANSVSPPAGCRWARDRTAPWVGFSFIMAS